MPRVHVYLPDDLYERVRALPERVNVSALAQDALRRLLDCDHDELRCETCAEPIDALDLRDDAVGAYYRDLVWELAELVDAGGTAEGAARVAKRVAELHAVSCVDRVKLPRPTRRRRQELADEARGLVA